MEKYFVFLAIAVLFGCNTYAHAQQYFDFTLDKNYADYGEEIIAQFLYSFEGYSENDFVVRPAMARGNIEIYNSENSVWVNQSDLWTNMPNLEKRMKVRTTLTGKEEISFEIQNTTNAEIYQTSTTIIWGGNLFDDYLEKVNKNIFRHNIKEEKAAPITNEPHQEKPQTLLAKMIKYIDGII